MVLCMYLKAQTGCTKFFIYIRNHRAFVQVKTWEWKLLQKPTSLSGKSQLSSSSSSSSASVIFIGFCSGRLGAFLLIAERIFLFLTSCLDSKKRLRLHSSKTPALKTSLRNLLTTDSSDSPSPTKIWALWAPLEMRGLTDEAADSFSHAKIWAS